MRWSVVSALLKRPTLGAELGAHGGRFTERLLIAHTGLTMIAVDTWVSRPMYESYDFASIRANFDQRMARFGDRVRPLQMETVAAADLVADGSLDFVFIDADHAYAAVAADIDAWRGKVKPGGILSGHDYGHPRFPGVKQAVDERLTVQTDDDHVWWVRC
jgi:SAM-dependent methyltransferase